VVWSESEGTTSRLTISGVYFLMLEALGLTKFYSAIPAVRDVTFRLEAGGILGLLGPNGSGKSTTVSMLAGLLEPSGGRVVVDGEDVRTDLLRYKASIGYVPEEAVLYSYLTGPEYLSLIGNLRGLAPRTIRERIDGFLTLFNLRDDVHAPISAYSKGMRQKILISAALLHNPGIVILDEPNSGLDVTTTLVLRSLVQTLAGEGRMIVYSSHVLEAIEQVATDVLILADGRVVAHDSVDRLRSLMELPSLEQVFRTLVIETDIDGVARDLVAVMKR
jgi:ABC-2 type transport system ATP-binding protein